MTIRNIWHRHMIHSKHLLNPELVWYINQLFWLGNSAFLVFNNVHWSTSHWDSNTIVLSLFKRSYCFGQYSNAWSLRSRSFFIAHVFSNFFLLIFSCTSSFLIMSHFRLHASLSWLFGICSHAKFRRMFAITAHVRHYKKRWKGRVSYLYSILS